VAVVIGTTVEVLVLVVSNVDVLVLILVLGGVVDSMDEIVLVVGNSDEGVDSMVEVDVLVFGVIDVGGVVPIDEVVLVPSVVDVDDAIVLVLCNVDGCVIGTEAVEVVEEGGCVTTLLHPYAL
jgi:hypothetical protein